MSHCSAGGGVCSMGATRHRWRLYSSSLGRVWRSFLVRASPVYVFFFQAEDGIRDGHVTGVQTCALPIYGLRTSEVVAITLDDIRWRQDSLRIHQPKTSSLLELPLINEVSSAIVKHLKRTPPPPRYRRIFLRMRAPIGVLKRTAVGEAFQSLVRKSGLRIPFQGPHCMRHSLAVHLLKSGTPLKTIGDILGHRSAASTSTYLRLATGDLREVALPVPGRWRQAKEGER